MKRLLALLVVVALAAVACGGGDEAPDTNEGASEPAESPSTEAPFASDDDEEADGMDACLKEKKAKTEISVTQVDFLFKPSKLKAPAGEMVTVVVQNDGTVEHTFTSDDLECDSGFIAAGSKATVTFEMPDKPVAFYCIPHESAMTGQIVPS